MVESSTLVIGKEEQLILQDWTAKGAAEHIPAQRRLAEDAVVIGSCWINEPADPKPIFPLIRIEFVIPEELEDIAVIVVRA